MRILDETGGEIQNPDLTLGYLKQDQVLLAHHEAVEAVAEQWHYEYTVYPNGGRDRNRVVDVPGVAGKDAWDEYEQIRRYVPYTAEELAQLQKPTAQDDTDAMLVDHEYRLTLLELGI